MYPEGKLESSPLATTYHISSARRRSVMRLYAVVPCIFGVFLLILFAMRIPWSTSPFALFVVCGFVVAAGTSVLRFIDRISLRLVISPEGIAYIGVGYRIFTPWENVTGTGVRKVASEVHEGREIWGLMLSQPAPVFKVRAWARYLMGWKDAEASFIPVSDFTGYPDELAQHIQYYVPAFSGL